jgi:hypothetical protein
MGGTPDAPGTPGCGTAPDPCAAAVDLTAMAMLPGGVTVDGDTTGLTDDVQPPGTGCTGFLPDGPDAIYKVTAAAGKTIRATAMPVGWDISVWIGSACASDACVAGADAVIDGDETVSFAATVAGTYFVVVDGWDPAAVGCYGLTVALE